MDWKSADIPADYRPAPFWSWNDKLCRDELLRQLDEFEAQGFGGFYMHSRVGLITGYLSSEWMALVEACVTAAEKKGMKAWLYDEDRWPSGFAAGVVPRLDERFRDRCLALVDESLATGHEILGRVDTPEGTKVLAVMVSELGDPRFNMTSYVDLFNPDAVQAFLTSTHEKYADRFQAYFGGTVEGVFTDEACYSMAPLRPFPCVPWSDNLAAFFYHEKGYRIEDRAAQLFLDTGDYRRVRFDFYECATRLFLENFTKPYAAWCEEHGLKLTGHLMGEDHLTHQVQWIGSAMPHYAYMQQPGIDKLFRNVEQVVAIRQLSSVTEQLGGRRALCECFAGTGNDGGFVVRKWIADWMAVHGINYINPHLALYSMKGERKRDYPPNLFYQQPWWEEEQLFSAYTARLCALAAYGKRSVRVLILHPMSSVWCLYTPVAGTQGQTGAEEVDEAFQTLAKRLAAEKIEYHFGDELLLEEHARLENGKLLVGECEYDLVVVPSCVNLRGSTVRLLRGLTSTQLVNVGQAPALIDGIPAETEWPDMRRFADEAELAAWLKKAGYASVRVETAQGDNVPEIIACVRDGEDGAAVLLVNTNREQEYAVTVTVNRPGTPWLFSLSEGGETPMAAEQTPDGFRFEATLLPCGSLALHVRDGVAAKDGKRPILSPDGAVIAGDGELRVAGVCEPGIPVLPDENCLPLTTVDLWVNGHRICRNTDVSRLWYDTFYALEEGTPFEAEYRFDVQEVPEGRLYAAIESAENLEAIHCNGRPVTPMRHKGDAQVLDDTAYLDAGFTRVELTGTVVKGTNVLRIAGKKYNNIVGKGNHVVVDSPETYAPTELEAVYITGNFEVGSLDRYAFYIRPRGNGRSGDMTACGYPFYAGRAEYTFSADIPQAAKVYLCLSGYSGASAACWCEGQKIRAAGFAPYAFDLTPFGGRHVQIRLRCAGDLFNLMGPAHFVGLENELWVTANSFDDTAHYTRRALLHPFKLDGAFLVTAE